MNPSTNPTRPIVNIAGYKFVRLDNLPLLRRRWLQLGHELDLKGTVLVSPEGINLFVAGMPSNVERLVNEIRQAPGLDDLQVKRSFSDHQPFNRFLVRIKREIIAFGVDDVSPCEHSSPKLSPTELKSWIESHQDFTLLDVRNNYEVEIGTFENAVPIDIDHFRDFPQAVDKLPQEIADKPVVMFCTGGIRCEKAGPLMEQKGFGKVFQLDGGILKYFEQCGGAHYQGECFVFDKRVALAPDLSETETTQCYACQHVLTAADLQDSRYQPPNACPFCFVEPSKAMQASLARRQERISELARDLPGRHPYHNIRPMNVSRRDDGQSTIGFLTTMHPHIPRQSWLERIQQGLIIRDGVPLEKDATLRAGERIEHHIPAMTEPDVNGEIEILFEDEAIVVVNKPAPLPQHPSGRFNRNTLMYFLQNVYEHPLRAVHRLDANTTGVVVLARTRHYANLLRQQFEGRQVDKSYLARVLGHPVHQTAVLDYAIGDQTIAAGGRELREDGKRSTTNIELIRKDPDHTSLVRAIPVTGRTNQIRIHLWKWGHPVSGDPMYQQDGIHVDRQTLGISDPSMCLHAESIQFQHPINHEPVRFTAPRPCWLKQPSHPQLLQ